MTRPTDAELAEIEARANAATPGPWKCIEVDDRHEIIMASALDDASTCETRHKITYDHGLYPPLDAYSDDDEECEECGAEQEQWEEANANAVFISHARTDVPTLLAEIYALKATINQMDEEIARYRNRLEQANVEVE